MVNWMKVGTDVVVGGGAGAVDQLVQNADDKRDVGMMSKYGTYYNYGVPILAVLATALGYLRGDMATRFVTAGAQLAGRKVTHQVTKAGPVPFRKWNKDKGGGGSRGVGIEF